MSPTYAIIVPSVCISLLLIVVSNTISNKIDMIVTGDETVLWMVQQSTDKLQDKRGNHCKSSVVYPPYNSDLAPCDFSFFSNLKKDLHGKYFVDEM